MAKKKPAVPENAWSHSAGDRGATIRVAEAWDKGGAVYLYRTVDRKPVKKALAEYLDLGQPFMVRDSRGGILVGQTKKAIEAAEKCAADLRLGLDPFRGTRKVPPPRDAALPTIKEAFDDALHSSKAIYLAETNHMVDKVRAANNVLAALGRGDEKNRSYPLCEEILPSTAEDIWRFMLQRATGPKHLLREAARAVEVLYQVLGRFHARYPHRYPIPAKPPKNWKHELRKDWASKFRVNVATTSASRPRFTQRETNLIFANLHRADPRVALMIELAADQRSGQVIRATRLDLDLTPGTGGLGHGRLDLIPHERGHKHTTVVDLTAYAREALRKAMGPGGYLHNLEQAF